MSKTARLSIIVVIGCLVAPSAMANGDSTRGRGNPGQTVIVPPAVTPPAVTPRQGNAWGVPPLRSTVGVSGGIANQVSRTLEPIYLTNMSAFKVPDTTIRAGRRVTRAGRKEIAVHTRHKRGTTVRYFDDLGNGQTRHRKTEVYLGGFSILRKPSATYRPTRSKPVNRAATAAQLRRTRSGKHRPR